MRNEKICGNCWHFEELIYAAHKGKCLISKESGIKNPHADTQGCDQFDSRYDEDEEEYNELEALRLQNKLLRKMIFNIE